MTEGEERAYEVGQRALARRILAELIKGGDLGPADGTAQRWRLERGDAVAMLRQVCEAFGDNEWDDNLYLADVIEKHLWKHLESASTLRRRASRKEPK